MPAVTLAPGLTATVALTVVAADLAPAYRSGDVPVLATPRLVALCEEADRGRRGGASRPKARPRWAPGWTGTPGGIVGGRGVQATAVLEEVAGRRLAFAVTARGGERVVARGRIERVVVDRSRFLGRLEA